MKNLFTYLKALWGAWGNLQSKDVRHDCRLTVGSPSGLDAKWKQNPFMRFAVVLTLIFTIGIGNVWGETSTLTFTDECGGSGTANDGVVWTVTSDAAESIYDATKGIHYGTSKVAVSYLRLSTSGISGTITKIVVNTSGASSTTATVSVTVGGSAYGGAAKSITTSAANYTFTGSASGAIQVSITQSSAKRAVYCKSITVTYSAASCEANPTIGNASLNGSVSLSSVPFSCSVSSEGGTGCSITDAGFVWKSGSDPSGSDNKTAGTFSTNITGTIPSAGSFSLGTTYYVKAYATNGKGTVLSETSYQYRVQSVTFNGNTSTSGSMSTQYVEYNKSTALTSNAFSKTGYTFAGWATAADGDVAYTNGQGVSATANLNLYAKWTAKTTTISFNQTSGTGGQTGTLTATYDAAMPSAPVTCPTREGYDFGGYYDGPGGTGTQYYTNTGASARTWNKEDVTYTLHAKWTAKNYTVTWMVNGVAYMTGDPSDNADYGAQVTKLPTAPTPPCGEVFVGWSKTNIGTTGLDKDDDAAAITALNLFTTPAGSPTIEGSTIFYAVFADYTTE